MKKFLFVVTISSLVSLSAMAADPVNPLSVALPAGNLVLPEPPTVGSLIWQNDSVVYFEARELRRLKRAVTVEDSTLLALLGVTKKVGTIITVDSLIAKKREPYISWLKTYGADTAINIPTLGDKTVFPYLCRLDSLCEKMKSYNTHESLYRVRQRPYYYFHDYYDSKGQLVEKPDNYDSYPSGHGYFCGLFGLCMHYIDPSHAKEIKKNSDTFGYQRLILGAHWASDIQAGNILGAIAYSIALNDPTFKQLLEDAKQELADYRLQAVPQRIPEDKEGTQTLAEAQAAIQNRLTSLKDACDNNPSMRLDIEITRTFFCDSFFNSLCLPFSLSEEEWADSEKNPLAAGTLKRFVGAQIVDSTLEITIESAVSIEAGVPYLVSFPKGADIVNPIFKQVRITEDNAGAIDDDKMACNGLFKPFDVPKGKNSGYLLLGANNGLYWPADDGAYMKGFRAYFKVSDKPSAASIRRGMRAIFADHKVPTAISTIVWKEGGVVKAIEHGQLMIISDGIKYNVQGQIIR